MSAQHFLRVDRPILGALPVSNRDAAALARAARARCAFQDRLLGTFRRNVEGVGAEPTDSDLRTFASLVAAEHELKQRLNRETDLEPPSKAIIKGLESQNLERLCEREWSTFHGTRRAVRR